jgi:DNA-directed RNA polymerase omega subunit
MLGTAKAAEVVEHASVPIPKMDSRFRLIIVAGLRSKQLLHGSKPRINVNPLRRRNTSIALEEVRQGLVNFTIGARTDHSHSGNNKALL